jgi:hypothetical protein
VRRGLTPAWAKEPSIGNKTIKGSSQNLLEIVR